MAFYIFVTIFDCAPIPVQARLARMAKSVQNMKQERERLAQMHRSMPDSKDKNAREVAARIKNLDTRIAAEDVPGKSKKKSDKGGVPVLVLVAFAVSFAFLAFAVSYVIGSRY